MSGTSKEKFIARVRAALGEGRQVSRRLPCDLDLVDRVADDADLAQLFEERAVAVGMEVVKVAEASIESSIIDYLQAHQLTTVSAAEDPLLGPGFPEALASVGIDLVSHREPGYSDRLYDEVDVGITVATAAVASTGSIACVSSALEARALSLVPPRHIALLPTSRLVGELHHLWRKSGPLQGRPLPSGVALVTGPSKTADIEGVLINGVHGPGAVTVFLIPEGAAQ